MGFFIPIVYAHFPYYTESEEADKAFASYVALNVIPFLRMCDRLETDNVGYGLTVCFSPSLLELLSRKQTVEYCVDFLEQSYTVLESADLADSYNSFKYNWLRDLHCWFTDKFKSSIPEALANIASFGNIELAATSATNAALPLFSANPKIIKSQLATGISTYRNCFGCKPASFWLNGALSFSVLPQILSELDVSSYFCSVDSFKHAKAAIADGAYRPVWAHENVAAFALNNDFIAQICSSDIGYYKDPDYLASVSDFMISKLDDKSGHNASYGSSAALNKADSHAAHYLGELQNKFAGDSDICAVAFDISWFGQNWFEGSHFFDMLFKKMYFDQNIIKSVTPTQYLSINNHLQKVIPGEGELGSEKIFESYYNCGIDELIPEIELAYERMAKVSGEERIMLQMGRELLQAISFDSVEYTEFTTIPAQCRQRLGRFCALDKIMHEGGDVELLSAIEDDSLTFSGISLEPFKVTVGAF